MTEYDRTNTGVTKIVTGGTRSNIYDTVITTECIRTNFDETRIITEGSRAW